MSYVYNIFATVENKSDKTKKRITKKNLKKKQPQRIENEEKKSQKKTSCNIQNKLQPPVV